MGTDGLLGQEAADLPSQAAGIKRSGELTARKTRDETQGRTSRFPKWKQRGSEARAWAEAGI
jgi:hypothetical protein